MATIAATSRVITLAGILTRVHSTQVKFVGGINSKLIGVGVQDMLHTVDLVARLGISRWMRCRLADEATALLINTDHR